MPDEQRRHYTLEQLRTFADDRAYRLEQDAQRRGCWWGDSKIEHEVMQAYMGLIERINGDPVILGRLKGKP